jgi:hypothetical protein
VFDPDQPPSYELWSVASEDYSTGTAGSTVFDFDADGSAEVVYADECHLRIHDGSNGELLWSTENTSRTLFEAPVVADVDRDGNAELVVVSSSIPDAIDCSARSLPFAGGPTIGVRVFGDALDNWVPTRAVWNQHTYHIDNIADDGHTLPRAEAASWLSHNSYRLNALGDPQLATLAPDLIVPELRAVPQGCDGVALEARLENRGALGVGPGVNVAFYAGDASDRGPLLGVAVSAERLLAGDSEWVTLMLKSPPWQDATKLRFHAVADDDGRGHGTQNECAEGNNASLPADADCRGPM